MNCWLIQKLLPLYISDDDFILLHWLIKKHLEKCCHCQEIHQQYIDSRRALQSLKKYVIPEKLLEGQWERIQSAIEPPKKREPAFNIRMGLSLAAIFLGLIVLYIVFPIQTFFKPAHSSKPSSKETRQIPTNLPPSPNSQEIISTNSQEIIYEDIARLRFIIKEKSNSGIILNKNEDNEKEYGLNEVSPLKNKKASF